MDVDETAARGLEQTYDDSFYADLSHQVRSSAEVIVPIILDLLKPRSVLDVGCGHGTWLAVFTDRGVPEVVGVDGPHISPLDLEIPVDAFLARSLDAPLDLGRRFDLAVCLEVAEHLDPSLGPTLVSSLVAHSSAVLFSAAIPLQGGAGHVNERWPSEWGDLFGAHDYACIDCVRPAVWYDERVAFWYAQNTVLYVENRQAQALGASLVERPLDLVHPKLYLGRRTPAKASPPSLSRVLRQLPAAAARATRNRWDRAIGRDA